MCKTKSESPQKKRACHETIQELVWCQIYVHKSQTFTVASAPAGTGLVLRSERVSESGNFYDFSGSLPIDSFYFDIISKEGVCE